jgi:hypothetical protein
VIVLFPSPRVARLCALAALSLWALGGWVQASEAFQLTPHAFKIPERGHVTGYLLLAGSNRFTFLPPHEWQAKANPVKHEVVLMRRDLVTSITIKIQTSAEATEKIDPVRLRDRVQENYPQARVTEEFPCYTRGREGLCLGFEWLTPAKTKAYTHLACVPFASGTIEFNLTAPVAKFPGCRRALGTLLGSFHAEP